MPTINLKRNSIKRIKWNKNQSAEYYNSVGWKTLRNAYIAQHPLCERCLLKGISRQAEQVHHVQEFLTGKTEEERWSLLLNPNNLMSLCKDCHYEIHHPSAHRAQQIPPHRFFEESGAEYRPQVTSQNR